MSQAAPSPPQREAPPEGRPFDIYYIADRQRFQTFLGQGAAAVVIVDAAWTLRYLSPSARQVFARFPSARPGGHLFSLIHGHDLERIIRHLGRLPDGQRGKPFLARFFTRRDRWQWFAVRAGRFSYRGRQDVTALYLRHLSTCSEAPR